MESGHQPETAGQLPLLGPVTYYVDRTDCVQLGLSAEHKRGIRKLFEVELRIGRGDFSGMRKFYASMPKDCRLFLLTVRLTLIGAIGSRDVTLFDEVLADLHEYPERCRLPFARMGMEITESWLRCWLRVDNGYPAYLKHFNLSEIPLDWRYQVGYLGVRLYQRKGNLEAAYAAAEFLLNLSPSDTRPQATDLYLKVTEAVICRELGRRDDMERTFRSAVEVAKALGYVTPFYGVLLGARSSMERMMSEMAPELLEKVRQGSDAFSLNVIWFHNHYTGEHVTEKLTAREYYMALQLKRKTSYKEIAEQMEVSFNRVRNMAAHIYEKLDIHDRDGLVSLVS